MSICRNKSVGCASSSSGESHSATSFGQVTVTIGPDWSKQGDYGSVNAYEYLFKRVGNAVGIDWRLVAAHAMQESSLNPYATNGSGGNKTWGLWQIRENTWADVGASPKPTNDEEVCGDVYITLMKQRLNKFSNVSDPNERIALAIQAWHDGRYAFNGTTWAERKYTEAGKSIGASNESKTYLKNVLEHYKKICGTA